MTTLLHPSSDQETATTPHVETPVAWPIGEPRLLAGLNEQYRLDLAAHRATHPTAPALTRSDYETLTAQVDLLGRGGAGFPVTRKLAALPARGTWAVVVNGSESEPLSFKDRLLMRRAPHLVLDGAVELARALRARRVVVSVHDPESYTSLRAAVEERSDRVRIRIVSGPGWFVAGEARSVLRHAGGGAAVPTGRRTLPSDKGLDDRPTFVSNVETFAQLALLARAGELAYAEHGVREEPGTSLLTVVGAVAYPGVVEVPNGIPLPVVTRATGAAEHGAVLLGGYHGSWLDTDVSLSRPLLREQGHTLGAGVVAVVGPDSCPLGEVHRVAHWLARQSAGQCGPCVFGLPALVRDLDSALAGVPRAADELLRHAELVNGRGACAHPDGVARFVTSSVQRFADDLELHRRHGSCGRGVRGDLGVGPVETTRNGRRR